MIASTCKRLFCELCESLLATHSLNAVLVLSSLGLCEASGFPRSSSSPERARTLHPHAVFPRILLFLGSKSRPRPS